MVKDSLPLQVWDTLYSKMKNQDFLSDQKVYDMATLEVLFLKDASHRGFFYRNVCAVKNAVKSAFWP